MMCLSIGALPQSRSQICGSGSAHRARQDQAHQGHGVCGPAARERLLRPIPHIVGRFACVQPVRLLLSLFSQASNAGVAHHWGKVSSAPVQLHCFCLFFYFVVYFIFIFDFRKSNVMWFALNLITQIHI